MSEGYADRPVQVRRVLAAGELGERSPAIERGLELAGATGAELLAVDVTAGAAGGAGAGRDALARDAADAGVRAGAEVAGSPVPQAVAERVSSWQADVVVVDRPTRRPLSRMRRHDVARRMLRARSVPVLSAHPDGGGPGRRVIVTVDLSPASLQAVRLAAALAPDAELHLLLAYHARGAGVMQRTHEPEERLRALLAEYEAEHREPMDRFQASLGALAGRTVGDLRPRLGGHPVGPLSAELDAGLVVVADGTPVERMLRLGRDVLAPAAGSAAPLPPPG